MSAFPDRANALPEVPNDPGHPLRPFTFLWMDTGHGDARTWYSYTARDEFHRVERIVRVPRRRPMAGLKPRKDELVVTTEQTHYHFDDDGAGGPPPEGTGPFGGMTYDEMIAELVRRHGPYYAEGALDEHPLVVAWRGGTEIEWTSAPAPFPVGSLVRRHARDLAEDHPDLAERIRAKVHTVVQAHALYSKLETPRGPEWVANRLLEAVDSAEVAAGR